MVMKCNVCGEDIESLKDFYTRTLCRDCYNDYHRLYYARNREKCIRATIKSRAAHIKFNGPTVSGGYRPALELESKVFLRRNRNGTMTICDKQTRKRIA